MDYQVSKKIRGISWLPKEKLAARKRTLPHEFGYFLIRCISARQFRSIIPLEPGPLQRSVTFRFSYQRSSHHLPLLCFPVQQRSSAASSTSSQFLNQDTHTHTHTHIYTVERHQALQRSDRATAVEPERIIRTVEEFARCGIPCSSLPR